MRNTAITVMVAGFAALLLGACSGGGSFESNKPPVADAGVPLTVNVGQLVTLDGRGSSDPNDNLVAYQWTQVPGGTAVTLSGASTSQPTFTVPNLPLGSTLAFSLTVTDSEGLKSSPDTVTVTVSNVTTIAVTGTVRFERVPFRSLPPIRLDYANPVLMPARGVVIRAIRVADQAVLAASTTSDTGTYSFDVPTNTSIFIQVEARLQRNAALPNWNIRVQNGVSPLAPYRVASPAFNSSAGAQNIDIRTGISAMGVGAGTSTRPSGPFAVLDTLYTVIQNVLTAVPTVNLPELYLNWGQDQGAYFATDANLRQFIALSSDLTEDTDEFDQPVIAHEFTHYLEANFSRGDSIGGSHGLGDRLDPSVAFSEGIATAFGAIALGTPTYIDSYVDGGVPSAASILVETNPGTGMSVPSAGVGCWCSESTVWALGWDLWDDTPGEANDNVHLPFTAVWQALTAHRNSPALTNIFTFISGLRAAQPAEAGNIDALVTAQNITAAGINEFATTENHTPFSNLLPIYKDITAGGGPVTVHTTNDAGTYNKVGNRRYLKFVAPGTGPYTFTLTTSNPNAQSDPDFVILRDGNVVASGEDAPAASEQETVLTIAGATYVIDAYDCANGCPPEPQQGIPGDYDLTMTIN